MTNFFDYFTKLIETQQNAFIELTKPVMTDEFTFSQIDGEIKVFVEGRWISVVDFVIEYKRMRDKLRSL